MFEINLEASISEEGHETNCLPLLDDRDYILTLDFALKVQQLHMYIIIMLYGSTPHVGVT